jgi:hypothetical protein
MVCCRDERPNVRIGLPIRTILPAIRRSAGIVAWSLATSLVPTCSDTMAAGFPRNGEGWRPPLLPLNTRDAKNSMRHRVEEQDVVRTAMARSQEHHANRNDPNVRGADRGI